MLRALTFVCLVNLAACATLGSVRSAAPGDGSQRLFAADLRRAGVAVSDAVHGTRLRIVEARSVDSHNWYVIAEDEPSDAVVRVWCEALDQDVVALRILTDRDILTSGPDWVETLFALIMLRLDPA